MFGIFIIFLLYLKKIKKLKKNQPTWKIVCNTEPDMNIVTITCLWIQKSLRMIPLVVQMFKNNTKPIHVNINLLSFKLLRVYFSSPCFSLQTTSGLTSVWRCTENILHSRHKHTERVRSISTPSPPCMNPDQFNIIMGSRS